MASTKVIITLATFAATMLFCLHVTSSMIIQCDTICDDSAVKHSGPVCSTKGKTYSNICSFLKANCRNEYKLRLYSNGPCKTADAVIIDKKESDVKEDKEDDVKKDRDDDVKEDVSDEDVDSDVDEDEDEEENEI